MVMQLGGASRRLKAVVAMLVIALDGEAVGTAVGATTGLFDIARTISMAGVAETTRATAGLVSETPTGVGSD